MVKSLLSWVNSLKVVNRILLVGLTSVLMFVLVVFTWALPKINDSLMDKKREKLKDQIDVVHALLTHYQELQGQGRLTQPEAQKQALAAVESLRYGPEMKDYFWINDTQPVMLMHPYNAALVGKSIAEVKDSTGLRMFVEFVRVCESQGAGFVSYMWQWNGDKDRIVPKISYVRMFKPWGWVVGTGVYIEDVRAELRALRLRFIGVFVIVSLLASLVSWAMAVPIAGTIERMVATFKDISGSLARASTHLTGTASRLATNSESMNTQSTLVAGAGTQLSSNINSLAATSHELSSSANTVAASVEEINASIKEVARNCAKEVEISRKADEQTTLTLNVMGRLGESAKVIGDVVKLITSISGQINLLALNAAIEASRAGDAGKGFAVVAKEVKELAKASAQATEKIRHQIEEIQQNTLVSLSAVEQVSGIIREVKDISTAITDGVQQQAMATQEIANNLSSVSQASSDLSRNINEMSAVAKDVSRSIEGVSVVAREVSASSEETKTKAGELNATSDSLNVFIDSVTV